MSNKIAFVTGAGRGIGRQIALTLASKEVIIAVSDLNEENANETVSLIKEAGGKAIAIYCDVTQLASVEEAVQTVTNELGRIDILINNAGWDKVEPFLKVSQIPGIES